MEITFDPPKRDKTLNGDEIIFEGETVSELKEDFAAGIDHYLDARLGGANRRNVFFSLADH